MMGIGKVIGGLYINGSVDTNIKGDLVVQLAFRRRKLSADEVATWEEVIPEARGGVAGTVGAVGEAVASVALPGIVGKMASAAVSATVDRAGRSRVVRIDWVEGKQSLIKLPEKLFTHLSLVLKDREVEPTVQSTTEQGSPEKSEQSGTAQVLTQLSGLIRDIRPDRSEKRVAVPVDIGEQITQLAALRDQGLLSEDEFVVKKTELIARL